MHHVHVAGVIDLLLQVAEVHRGEGHKLFIEHNVLQMFIEEQTVADTDFTEGLGSRNFWAHARAVLPLRRVTHPVVPVAARPLDRQLVPQRLRDHPPQPREEVSAVQQLWLLLNNISVNRSDP